MSLTNNVYNFYLLPFLRYSTSNNGIILKIELGYVRDHVLFDKQCTTSCWSPIVNIALSYTIIKLFDVE